MLASSSLLPEIRRIGSRDLSSQVQSFASQVPLWPEANRAFGRTATNNCFPYSIRCVSRVQARTEVEFVSIRVNHSKISDSTLEVLRRRLRFYSHGSNLCV